MFIFSRRRTLPFHHSHRKEQNNENILNNGVIFQRTGTLVISSSSFSNNTTPFAGGCLCTSPNAHSSFLTNTSFISSSAKRGGAILFNSPATIAFSVFTQNSAEEGGAIWASRTHFYLFDCVFRQNKAKGRHPAGAAIVLVGSDSEDIFCIKGCRFEHNHNTVPSRGADLAFFDSDGKSFESYLLNLTTTTIDSIVLIDTEDARVHPNLSSSVSVGDSAESSLLHHSSLIPINQSPHPPSQLAQNEDTIVSVSVSSSGTDTSPCLTGSSSCATFSYLINGIDISRADRGFGYQISLASNQHFTHSEEIIINCTLSLISSGFVDSDSFSSHARLTMTNTFKFNTTSLVTVTAKGVHFIRTHDIEIFYCYGDTTIHRCIISQPSSEVFSTVACVSSEKSLTVTASSFSGIQSEAPGACISFESGLSTLSDTSFTDCASKDSGGALYMSGYVQKTTITRCVFENCLSTGTQKHGGAICMGSNSSHTIRGCQFIRCRSLDAKGCGGAIEIWSTVNTFKIDIVDCHFLECWAGSTLGSCIFYNQDFLKAYRTMFSLSGSYATNCDSPHLIGGIYPADDVDVAKGLDYILTTAIGYTSYRVDSSSSDETAGCAQRQGCQTLTTALAQVTHSRSGLFLQGTITHSGAIEMKAPEMMLVGTSTSTTLSLTPTGVVIPISSSQACEIARLQIILQSLPPNHAIITTSGTLIMNSVTITVSVLSPLTSPFILASLGNGAKLTIISTSFPTPESTSGPIGAYIDVELRGSSCLEFDGLQIQSGTVSDTQYAVHIDCQSALPTIVLNDIQVKRTNKTGSTDPRNFLFTTSSVSYFVLSYKPQLQPFFEDVDLINQNFVKDGLLSDPVQFTYFPPETEVSSVRAGGSDAEDGTDCGIQSSKNCMSIPYSLLRTNLSSFRIELDDITVSTPTNFPIDCEVVSLKANNERSSYIVTNPFSLTSPIFESSHSLTLNSLSFSLPSTQIFTSLISSTSSSAHLAITSCVFEGDRHLRVPLVTSLGGTVRVDRATLDEKTVDSLATLFDLVISDTSPSSASLSSLVINNIHANYDSPLLSLSHTDPSSSSSSSSIFRLDSLSFQSISVSSQTSLSFGNSPVCGWTSAVISIKSGTAILTNIILSNCAVGGLLLTNAVVVIESGAFTTNGRFLNPTTISKNIHASNSSLTVNDGVYFDAADSRHSTTNLWIDADDSSSVKLSTPRHPLFHPTVISAEGESSSNHSEFEVTLVCANLIPACTEMSGFVRSTNGTSQYIASFSLTVSSDSRTVIGSFNLSNLTDYFLTQWEAGIIFDSHSLVSDAYKIKEANVPPFEPDPPDPEPLAKWVPVFVGIFVPVFSLIVVGVIVLIVVLHRVRKNKQRDQSDTDANAYETAAQDEMQTVHNPTDIDENWDFDGPRPNVPSAVPGEIKHAADSLVFPELDPPSSSSSHDLPPVPSPPPIVEDPPKDVATESLPSLGDRCPTPDFWDGEQEDDVDDDAIDLPLPPLPRLDLIPPPTPSPAHNEESDPIPPADDTESQIDALPPPPPPPPPDPVVSESSDEQKTSFTESKPDLDQDIHVFFSGFHQVGTDQFNMSFDDDDSFDPSLDF